MKTERIRLACRSERRKRRAVLMAGHERQSGGRTRLGWADSKALLGRSSFHVSCTHCDPSNPIE
jgi:hypothetical protein